MCRISDNINEKYYSSSHTFSNSDALKWRSEICALWWIGVALLILSPHNSIVYLWQKKNFNVPKWKESRILLCSLEHWNQLVAWIFFIAYSHSCRPISWQFAPNPHLNYDINFSSSPSVEHETKTLKTWIKCHLNTIIHFRFKGIDHLPKC